MLSVPKILIFIWLVSLLVLVGCDKNEIAGELSSNQNTLDEISVDAGQANSGKVVLDKIVGHTYIGEAFDCDYVYLEPFSETADIKEQSSPPADTIQLVSVAGNGFYKAKSEGRYIGYVPDNEPESIYFNRPISQQTDNIDLYKLSGAAITSPNPEMILAFTDYTPVVVDCSLSPTARPYSEQELQIVQKELIDDQQIAATARTLDYITSRNTILAAQQLCTISLKEIDAILRLSHYKTHGSEYVADVYVLDLVKGQEVLATYQKHNWDGPY